MITATTFFFMPPEGASWSLGLDRFAEQVQAAWPNIIIKRRQFPKSRISSGDAYIDFWNDEPRLDGLYASAESLNFSNSNPTDAAGFVAWFLSILPADAEVRFNSEEALETKVEFQTRDWWMPRDAGAEQVREVLEQHLRDVLGPDAR